MSTLQPPQDEIAAIRATLARHEEDLERLKQWLPETGDATGSPLQNLVAELRATRDGIRQELLAIRERLDALEAAQANTDREIASIKDDIASIKEEIASIKDELASIKETLAMLVARVDAMSSTLTETNSRLGNLTGSRLERRVARNIRVTLRRAIGLSQARVLHRDWGETDDDLIDLLDEAYELGSITWRERDDVLDADLIAAGANPDGQRAYALAEISVTVASLDVNRAARRARTIAKATGAECTAIVAGSEIPAAERERATRSGVAVIAVAARED